jgi:hypothetical protein
VNGPLQCRLAVLLVSAAVAFGAWKWIPGSPLDRTAFTTVAGGFSNPPWFVSGRGTHAEPWRLKVFSAAARADKSQAPLIVSLGDDPDGFFQSSPPAPIDLAVILTNFKRLGKNKAASGVVLAWGAPDPIGLAALERAMDGFESLVVTAPLSRGAVSSVMPPAFRRASIPVTTIQGDAALLPLVNRIPLPGVVLGGENAAAGFSELEFETTRSLPPLMAKWEDRVVFSFPLLAVLQRLDCPISDLEVKLGEYLKLGNTGRVIPIDSYGRLKLPMKRTDAPAEISAESVVDGNDTLFAKQPLGPVILRDDRTDAEPATRNFSSTLSATVSALASDHGLANVNRYPRLARVWEILILLATVLILGLVPSRLLYPCAWMVGGVCLAAQWTLLAMASVWMPGLAMLIAVFAVVLAGKVFRPKIPGASSVLVEESIFVEPPVQEAIVPPEPIPKASKTKRAPAKKTPAKKAAAKKAAKKTAAKKTATPRAPRTKKPPTES